MKVIIRIGPQPIATLHIHVRNVELEPQRGIFAESIRETTKLLSAFLRRLITLHPVSDDCNSRYRQRVVHRPYFRKRRSLPRPYLICNTMLRVRKHFIHEHTRGPCSQDGPPAVCTGRRFPSSGHSRIAREDSPTRSPRLVRLAAHRLTSKCLVRNMSWRP